ncbi:MAG TPA: bifunctional phosphoribosyl-AMP cyclohydrolase/phosphoribosyl-ATP diphosphatase HisIE [Vicinamibacteria bacterium]|nr:bifunctional phosphoribosyl-AMP cyclohydrolase/phosphoribosyl-ATP diphosphatase HisIE [Vicinamibacteria bacterium]
MRSLSFDESGLIPAIVQDADGDAVLMLGYMSADSLAKTLETGEVHFWSRSRGRIWRKGETSGNVLRAREILVDCDLDCLLVRAVPLGPTCHTGARSCFFERIDGSARTSSSLGDLVGRLVRTIRDRARSRPEGSYTAKLLESGVERVAQKVGEEATEVVIAAAKTSRDALAEESADLLYHLLVLWQAVGVTPEDVAGVLETRHSGRKP